MVTNLLIRGNSKMGDEVKMFNLPAKKTCTPTDWCLHGNGGKPMCYAMRGRSIWPNVIKGAEDRFKASKQEDFVDKMVAAIHKQDPKYFRLHASGDFYSEAYVKKIIEIAESCPDTLFRTTTRRRDLKEVIQELNSLDNFIVRESLDKERPTPEMGLPFAALDSLEVVARSDSYECINDCTPCGHYCWENAVDMHFPEH